MCKELSFPKMSSNDSKTMDDVLLESLKMSLKGIVLSYRTLTTTAEEYNVVANDPVRFAMGFEDAIAETEEELRSLFSSLKETASIIKNSSSIIQTNKEVTE